MKIKVRRIQNTVDVLILPHKEKDAYSFINLTTGHICPCEFKTLRDAIEDLDKHDNIISWEIMDATWSEISDYVEDITGFPFAWRDGVKYAYVIDKEFLPDPLYVKPQGSQEVVVQYKQKQLVFENLTDFFKQLDKFFQSYILGREYVKG